MTHFRVKTPAYVPGFLNAMDKFFSEDFQSAFAQSNYPAVNITEADNAYHITMMAPGLNKSDFRISLEDHILTIAYEKQEEKSEQTPKFIRKEFAMKSFKRSFTLNETLNGEAITASYDNGLLTLTVPKVETKADDSKVRTIDVN